MNPHESYFRRLKAEKLANVLQRAKCGPGQARLMSDEQWKLAAQVAGVKPPSAEARRIAIEMLQERAAMPYARVEGVGTLAH